MPPPLSALATIATLPDEALAGPADLGDGRAGTFQFSLYDLLRQEQALAVATQPARPEAARILDLAQSAYGELVALLVGRSDELLETARDGEWSLRDLLRHAIAVELRYAAQVAYSATRLDADPLAIPAERLPCDRLSPPEPMFADTRSAGIVRVLDLLGEARALTDSHLGTIPDAALARPSLWGTYELTVGMRIHQIAAHLTEVVVQAEKCLGGGLAAEARRVVRRSCAVRGTHERWSALEARRSLDARYARLAQGASRGGSSRVDPPAGPPSRKAR